MNDLDPNLQSLVENYWAARHGTWEGRHKWILRRFIEFVDRKPKPLHMITVKDMERFIADLRQAGYTAAYISNNFVFLRKFFDHLKSLGIVADNSARNTFARAEKREPRWFSDKELLQTHRRYHPRK